MSERIKELSKQAWEWAEQQEYNDPAQEFSDILEQKFAELIVRECMDLVKDCYAEPGRSLYQSVCASTIIEEHFGVEE